MENFTASNGVAVQREDQGTLVNSSRHGLMRLAVDEALALREFFLHERDQELGRWRWPENPDYVVYRDDRPGGFRVMHEPTGDTWTYFWDAIKDDPQFVGPWDAARAYFAAHPEPKQWHDAKHGEVWVIEYEGKEEAVVSTSRFFTWPHGSQQYHDDPDITAGRRIWPEVSDD